MRKILTALSILVVCARILGQDNVGIGDYPEKYEIESKLFSGFIAQEVEAAAEAVDYNLSGVSAPANEKDLYALRYAEFVVPLVKAVQELASQVKEQQETITILSNKIKELEE